MGALSLASSPRSFHQAPATHVLLRYLLVEISAMNAGLSCEMIEASKDRDTYGIFEDPR